MPRELVTVQVGQCGNQIGWRFWDLALREQLKSCKDMLFDESMSSFFRNVDTRYTPPRDIPLAGGANRIGSLRARAVLVDTEEGVVRQVMDSALGELFEHRQLITDVSGAGNNWAHGHKVYGPKYHDHILEQLRHELEHCDSPQSFFVMQSLGGGTGSGLGTYILALLAEEFPDLYRFTTAVFPSQDDDVITSPYNSMLALRELNDYCDCVLPIDNQALLDISATIQAGKAAKGGSAVTDVAAPAHGRRAATASSGGGAGGGAGAGAGGAAATSAFDGMNNIAAHLLTHLTSSMRFPGRLNVDLNEITTNLVPYPRLHYLMSSLSPLYALADVKANTEIRRLHQMFADAFSPSHQLIKADPRGHTYLACGLLVRGAVQVSDVQRNIQRMRSKLKMAYWNSEGFKVGLCNVAPLNQPYSLLCLANNCGIRDVFSSVKKRFDRLYRVKAHTHHYAEYMDLALFDEAVENVQWLVDEYSRLDSLKAPAGKEQRRYVVEF